MLSPGTAKDRMQIFCKALTLSVSDPDFWPGAERVDLDIAPQREKWVAEVMVIQKFFLPISYCLAPGKSLAADP